MRIASRLTHFAHQEILRPDFARGVRCMLSFTAPLILSLKGRLPVEVAFAAIAAQSIANVDVRGAYGLRFTLLLVKSAIIAAAAAFGALTGNPLEAALAATVVVAAASAFWRHLSTDYGPSLAVASSLVFYIALVEPGGAHVAAAHFQAAIVGGLWGVALQVAFWPFNPQHPLRVAVSDTWLALADVVAAATPQPNPGPNPPELVTELTPVGTAETNLRRMLDQAYATLDTAAARRRQPMIQRLRDLNICAAELGRKVSALHAAFDDAGCNADSSVAAAPFFAILQNFCRTAALAVVSRQPSHLAAAEVRLRRLDSLARVLLENLADRPETAAGKTLVDATRDVAAYLPRVRDALRATLDRADERAAFSLELFDLGEHGLRPLAAALNLSWRMDRLLARFFIRSATLAVIGVFLMKRIHLAHGYWIPFTMAVVLQPDYGSTRQRAAQRLLGTLIGSIVASVLLRLHPPMGILLAAVAGSCFVFGYYLRRNYAVAVVFITIFVVALTEATAPQTLALAAERLGCTVAGGGLALLAAFAFWPVWERDRVRPILAKGLRANGEVLAWAAGHPSGGGAASSVTPTLRRAEAANAEVFASLQRMAGDPKNRQAHLERLAALANGNQRITRSLTLAFGPAAPAGLGASDGPFLAAAQKAFEVLAQSLESGKAPAGDDVALRHDLARTAPPLLGRVAAELGAMLLIAEELGADEITRCANGRMGESSPACS